MRTLTLVVWGVLVVAAAALEVAGRRRADGLAPFGQVLGALRAPLVGRSLLLVGWMWLGWHLFAR